MSKKMEVLLVGGAIRDELLGLEVKDLDYLVAHGTPEYFLENGYENVGKDFPVFLHPETKDEYALARTERKIDVGYGGFETNFDPSVTVEEDLFRRDLTINAIAKRENGELVDPYNGVQDLKNKTLRHVSKHFAEDPVRVLRVARFMARYSGLGFTIDPETKTLMTNMVDSGELNHLTSERVFKEMEKSFTEPNPSKFFEVLRECGALQVVFPEIDNLFGVPQPKEYHPEIDTGVHTLMVLDQAALISNNNKEIMFAALLHDLGKKVTFEENKAKIESGEKITNAKGKEVSPEKLITTHVFHEAKGVKLVEEVCERLRVPKNYKNLAVVVCEQHTKMHNVTKLSNSVLFELYRSLGALRNDTIVDKFAQACEADAKGRTGFENNPYPQRDFLNHCIKYIQGVDNKVFIERGYKGKELGEVIENARIASLKDAKMFYKPNFEKICEDWKTIMQHPKKATNQEILRCIKSLTVGKNTKLFDSVFETVEATNKNFYKLAHDIVDIDVQKFLDKGLKNLEVGLAIDKERTELINFFKRPTQNKKYT